MGTLPRSPWATDGRPCGADAEATGCGKARNAVWREGDGAGLQLQIARSRAATKEGRSFAIRPDVPVLPVGRDKRTGAKLNGEYLLLDCGQILNVPLGEFREGNPRRNLCNLRIHMMKIIAEASPDPIERPSTFTGDKPSTDEKLCDLWALHAVVRFDPVALDDEIADSLGDRLRHHYGAEEVAISVELNAFTRCRCEMGVWRDELMRDLEVSAYALLDRRLELCPQVIADHVTPDTLWNASHSAFPRCPNSGGSRVSMRPSPLLLAPCSWLLHPRP